MNALGEPQLGDNGMVVSDNTNASWIAVYHLNLAVDSEDNAIITTVDQRTGVWEVYAWKIAPDGSMLWGDDGVALTTASTSNMSPRLTVLPDNSVVVTCTHNDNTVFFQRISAAGALLWGTGILIADNNANLLSPQPIVSGNGDVLIQWVRQTGPVWAADSELYLQKYDYDGNPQWSNPIVAAGPVVFPMGNWSQQSVADADSGSFSAWTEMSGNAQSAVVQHISGDGALSWTGSVDLSANSSNFRMSPQLTVADDTQELMAVWREANGSQSQRGVYAQRLDSSGNRLWGANGTAVVGLNSNYDYLDLSVAGFGDDLIAAYIEQSVNMNGDIYAARLDADGNYVWTGGAATVTNSGSPKSDMMTGKGLGCLFIAWTENGSVYTHCLLEDGTLGAPDAGGVLLVPSEYPTIQAAIDSASDGDMVLVADGIYTGTGNKELTWNGNEKHITVMSANGPDSCIIDLEGSGRAFTFISGLGDDAIWITPEDVIEGFTISNGSSSSYGGAIYCYYGYQNDVSPTISNCVFKNNTAVYGGAITIDGGSSTITNCVFDSNSADYGGAVYIGSAGGDSGPLFQNCTFLDNSADLHWNGQGGAFYLSNISTSANCRIWNNNFNGNSAPNGGAIYFSTSSPDVTENLFTNNSASTNASTLYIYNYYGPTISNCTITNNTGPEAVYCYGFNGTVEPVFVNTIVRDDSSAFAFDDTSQANPTISYCNLEGGFPITGTDGGGNIDADPLFCDPDSGDFTLAENSPCVGTGEDGANMGTYGVGCGPYNFTPTEFSLTEPSNNTAIMIDASNVDNGSITFSWDESSDANDDLLLYLMRAASAEIGNHGLDTNATSFSVAYADIIEDMIENNVTVATLEWTVHVTDGIDTLEANNAPFTVTIDGGYAMSVYLESLLPDKFAFHQNFPNPFNPVTTLRYDLPENSFVNVTIYDMLGRGIRTLVNTTQDAGFKSVIWNATNDFGKPVSAGVYLYQIQAGDFIQTKKMVLLK
ncbi:MAG: T9SS type A sorting domain-containing protein [Candidatus Marinimicrobia bacterium]|nr:T9SS type A sorting domain-containing protein [Candidatus Neomarinimicrobiota bacterium]